MFTTGMSPLLGQGFMLLTLIISVPDDAAVPQLAGDDLARARSALTTPMLFALGLVFVFGIGGLTGLYLGGHRRRPSTCTTPTSWSGTST